MSLPFTDPFDVDTGEWTYGGGCVVAGGMLTLAAAVGSTATAPDSTGTWAAAAGWQADFEILSDIPAGGQHTVAANFYTADLGIELDSQWTLQGGELIASVYDSVADTTTELFTATHNPVDHRWLRVALDDALTTLTWATSPDGSTWTVRHSEPFVWTDLELLAVGAFCISSTTDMEVGEVRVAAGVASEPFPVDASGSAFTVQITSLHTPTDDAEVLFAFTEFKDLSVKIPINDARTAELTVSMWDPVLDVLNGGHDLLDFEQYLRIYYRDQPQPVFWGPLRTEDDYAAGEIKITAVDALRVQHHFVRLGDAALNDPDDPDLGTLMADGSGIQYLLLAAQNIAGQNARGVPVLGMDVVDESSPREIPFEIQRGDNVWDKIVMISGTATGPDFELSPVDDETGLYAHLTVYDVQGTDRGRDANPVDGILFTFGAPPEVGADNLSNVRARKLNPITHAHVLDDRREHRKTAADEDSSADIGIYVEWVQSNVNLVDDDTTILEEIAAAYVDAYGRPPHAIDIDLRPDAVQQWFYNEDFFVGDIVSIYATKGYRGVINTHMRIITVELTQPGKRGPAVTRLSIVPYVARSIIDEDS